MVRNYKKLIVNILIPLAVGATSALISRGGMADFDTLRQPPLTPPGIVFPIVWTVLYILMGVAAYIVGESESGKASDTALGVYSAQLAFNFVWSPIFFGFGQYLFAFMWLVALWGLILLTIILFSRISKTAAYLLIPYLLWVTFAGYLNLGVYLLN